MNRYLPGLFVVLLALSACATTGGASSGTPSLSPTPEASEPSPATDGDGDDGSEGAIDHPTGSEAVLVISSAGGASG